MKWSPDELAFLRLWMRDEMNYLDGPGPAKLLQLQHRAIPADLSALIAAALPDPADQEAAALAATSGEAPSWPWTDDRLALRVSQARSILDRRQGASGRPAALEPASGR